MRKAPSHRCRRPIRRARATPRSRNKIGPRIQQYQTEKRHTEEESLPRKLGAEKGKSRHCRANPEKPCLIQDGPGGQAQIGARAAEARQVPLRQPQIGDGGTGEYPHARHRQVYRKGHGDGYGRSARHQPGDELPGRHVPSTCRNHVRQPRSPRQHRCYGEETGEAMERNRIAHRFRVG